MRPILFLVSLFFLHVLSGQTAPAHLRYFGFALVDMQWDDPHDLDATTNYIAEVDSFSNVAQLGIFNYTDNIVSRVALMNTHCVQPLLSIQSIFYSEADANAPSGHRLKLLADFKTRWEIFKANNTSVLNEASIGAFYVVDEPVWNGIVFQELDTVCKTIKNDFPDIPIMMVEAYPVLASLEVPETVDWIGFDRYAIFDPTTSTLFQEDLATLKSSRSTSTQKLFLIVDDQWLPFYGTAGYPPDTIGYMVQHYYDLAVSDADIIGMIGYLWAGGLDDPDQLGVRDMPQSVIDKNVEIGQLIKDNNNPCLINKTATSTAPQQRMTLYPNPASDFLHYDVAHETLLEIYSAVGNQVLSQRVTGSSVIDLRSIPAGLYVVRYDIIPDYRYVLIIDFR